MAEVIPFDKPKHAGGRPPKLTPEEKAIVYKAMEDYIARTPDPIIVGFCAWDPVAIEYDITDDNINDWEEFTRLRKRATQKQEAYLSTGVFSKGLNPTMAIFRLKQPVHGYTDRMQQDLTTNGKDLPVPILGAINVQQDNRDQQDLSA